MLRIPFLAAPLLLLAPSALAFQISHEFQGVTHTYVWPSTLGSADRFGRGVALHLRNLQTLDALQLDGDVAVAPVAPDQFFAASVLCASANDVDVLPGAGLLGLDAAVIVGAGGARLWWLDASGALASTTLMAGSWLGATNVRATNLDGNASPDLVGVAADHRTILKLVSSGGALPSFTASASFQTIANVRDVTPVQWDGDAPLELAVLSDAGVEVYDQDGSVLRTWTSVMPGGALTRIRQAGQALDRLVWITQYAPPAQQWLMTLSSSSANSGVDDLVDLGGLDVVASVPVDYDLDGDDDVLLSHHYSYKLVWLENQRSAASPFGASFTSSSSSTRLFPVDSDPSSANENKAWPIVGDFDGDGDFDIVFAVQRTMKLRVLRGEPIAEPSERVTVASASYEFLTGATHGTLTLGLQAATATPTAATHLEIELWRQSSLATDITQQAVSRQLVLLPSGSSFSVPISIPSTTQIFSGAYHVQLRLVSLGTGGAVAHAWPTQTGSFAIDKATVDTLAAELGAAAPIVVSSTIVEDNQYTPRVVQRTSASAFPAGAVPKSAP